MKRRSDTWALGQLKTVGGGGALITFIGAAVLPYLGAPILQPIIWLGIGMVVAAVVSYCDFISIPDEVVPKHHSIDTDNICIGCGTELIVGIDTSCTCARCTAEEAHDWDRDPYAAFERGGRRTDMNHLPRALESELLREQVIAYCPDAGSDENQRARLRIDEIRRQHG